MAVIARSALPPQSLEWADAQAQMLLDTWLLTLFALLLATAVPWFLDSLAIDFAGASWLLLLLGADYVAMAALANLRERRPRIAQRLLTVLHALGIVGIGLVWQRCGGTQNPLLLLVFILPVIGGSSLSRWQPYVSALVAVAVVAAVTLAATPELRWYAGGLDVVSRWLTALFGDGAATADVASAFPGFYAPVGYERVLLEVFAILLFFCALSAESIADVFQKIMQHLQAARGDASRAQELWTQLLQQLPLPALLVDTDTLQVVLASEARAPFWAGDSPLLGRALSDVLPCAYPERLQQLLAGDGGVATPVVIHVGDEPRVATVHVRPLAYEGSRLALLVVQDISEAFQLGAALDAEEHAALVISARGKILAANQPARALLPDVRVGSDAGRVLARSSGVQRWWEPGLTGRRRMHVTLMQRTYLTTCTATALPGEEEALFVLTFQPLLPAATGDRALSAVS